MVSNGTRSFLHALAALALLVVALPAPLAVAERAAGPDGAQAERLAPEQAIAVALNDLQATADGYRLRHPRHVATFTPDGVRFTPRRGGPEWAWRLTAVRAGEVSLPSVELGTIRPVQEQPGVVAYPRGGLIEQYLARQGGIEQQFVIPRRLTSGGADLVIAGTVRSAGAFAKTDDGWQWRTAEGAVRLGDVRAYDATGRDLPATMQVRATETRIVVDGEGLARAAYPVTIDPEIGANDFRLSDMGSVDSFAAWFPAVAYNSTENEYLVVWHGDDDTGSLVDEENEIYGQLVDAATGAEIGADFRLSDMGPDGDVSYFARFPAVAYNSADDEYLVVWWGVDSTLSAEIFGQRVNAATGAEVGTNDFRLSDMGPGGGAFFYPAVAYNSTANEYLVVWAGDDGTGGLAGNGFEIFGQRVNAATGAEIGSNDFRLSDMGPDGDATYAALSPALAYNSTANEYLVVWAGDDDTGSLVYNEPEIYGQRVDAATGAEVGTNDFRLSDMGPDGDANYGATDPAVTYNGTNNEYLVVWAGDDNTGGLVDEELEIYGQRVNAATGAEIGANDFRLSDMGPDGNANYAAHGPAVAYNDTGNEYLVVWAGDDDTGGLVDEELEIYGQRVNAATGAEIGTNDFRLSDMGPDGNANYDAYVSAVAYNSTEDEYLVVWHGDDDTGSLADEEFEIFGQWVDATTGAEIGTEFRLSDMGPDGDASYDAFSPAVAYNSASNEYLVVWYGDDDTGSLVNNETEIFGQLVDAATGVEVGTNDFRLSDMGPNGDTNYDALYPAVAYNSADNEYLVVWRGDDDTGPLVDEEWEIFGQRVSATGAEIGTDFRLSDMGPDGHTYYGAYRPAVAYNSVDNEYLVVWYGDDDTGPLVYDEHEIYGQRVSATGAEIGTDFRLSDMGPDGNQLYNARYPAVAYNSADNEYLVVWSGDDDTGGLVDEEFEIYGQRVNAATGAEIGTDLRLSDMGPGGDANYDAYRPAVAYNSASNEYLVVWYGDDDTGSLVYDETEIFGRRVDAATGTGIGTNDFRLSDMGPDGDANYDAWDPAVAYNSAGNEYLVVWYGDDDTGELVNNENEIFCQRVSAAGAEIGTDFRLSDMGPDGDRYYGTWHPAVAYNSADNEYLVVWRGDDNTGPLVDEEYEIFGQRFDANYWLYLPLILRSG